MTPSLSRWIIMNDIILTKIWDKCSIAAPWKVFLLFIARASLATSLCQFFGGSICSNMLLNHSFAWSCRHPLWLRASYIAPRRSTMVSSSALYLILLTTSAILIWKRDLKIWSSLKRSDKSSSKSASSSIWVRALPFSNSIRHSSHCPRKRTSWLCSVPEIFMIK